MALSADDKAAVRSRLANDVAQVRWTKPEIGAVLDALDAWWIGARGTVSSTIDGAKAGLTVAEKQAIVRAWLSYRLGAGA